MVTLEDTGRHTLCISDTYIEELKKYTNGYFSANRSEAFLSAWFLGVYILVCLVSGILETVKNRENPEITLPFC